MVTKMVHGIVGLGQGWHRMWPHIECLLLWWWWWWWWSWPSSGWNKEHLMEWGCGCPKVAVLQTHICPWHILPRNGPSLTSLVNISWFLVLSCLVGSHCSSPDTVFSFISFPFFLMFFIKLLSCLSLCLLSVGKEGYRPSFKCHLACQLTCLPTHWPHMDFCWPNTRGIYTPFLSFHSLCVWVCTPQAMSWIILMCKNKGMNHCRG